MELSIELTQPFYEAIVFGQPQVPYGDSKSKLGVARNPNNHCSVSAAVER